MGTEGMGESPPALEAAHSRLSPEKDGEPLKSPGSPGNTSPPHQHLATVTSSDNDQLSTAYVKLCDSILDFLAGLSCHRSNPLQALPKSTQAAPCRRKTLTSNDNMEHLDKGSDSASVEDNHEMCLDDTLVDMLNSGDKDPWDLHRHRISTVLTDMTAWRNDFSEEDLHNLFMSDVFNPDDSVESVKRLLLRVAVRLISITHLATSNKSITPTLRRAGDTLEENIKAVKQHGVEPHTLGSFSLKKRSTSSHLSSEGCFDPITVLEQDILSIGALDLAATLERHQQLRMLQKRKRTSSDAAEKTNRTVPFNTMEHGVKHSSRDTKPSRLTFVGTDHYNRLRRRRPPSSCGLPLSPSPNPHSPLSSPSKRFYRTPSIKKAEAKRTENACSSDCWASVEKDLQSIYRTWTETRPFPDIEKIIEDESLSLTLLVSSEYKPFSSDSIRSSLKPLQALAPGTGPDEKSDTNVFPKAVELPRIKDGSNRVTTGVLRALRTAIPKPDRKELNAASNPKLLGESLESIDFSLSVLQTCRKWEVHTDLGMECVARALRLSVEIALVDEFLSSALKLFTKLKDTERDRASNHITVAYLLAFLYKRFEEAQSTELGPSNKQAWERVNSQISELLFSLQCLITVPDANSTPRIPYERSSYFEGVEMTATLRGNQVESGSSSTAHDVTQDDGGSFDACLTAHVQGIQQLVPLYLLCSVACDKIKDN